MSGLSGIGRLRIADRAPMVVFADDQAVEQTLSRNFSAIGNSAARLLGDENARAAVA